MNNQKKRRKLLAEILHQEKSCLWCERKFKQFNNRNKWCSIRCRDKYKTHKMSETEWKKTKLTKKCRWCENEFHATRSNEKYCSKICKNKWHTKRSIRKKEYRLTEIAKQFNVTVQEYKKLTNQCEMCGWTENINIHHIIRKKDGGKNEIKNYMSLCYNCHRLLHYTESIEMVKSKVKEYKNKIKARGKKNAENE